MRRLRRFLEWLRILPARPAPPLHPLVLDYIRRHPDKIASDVRANNALLRYLKERTKP